MWTPLILDTFMFDEASLEVPERFADLGGNQRLVQHDFPGGIRTQKALGYFPSALRWRAKSSAQDAGDRIEALKRLVVAGKEIKLTWGQRGWYGRLSHIAPTAINDFLYEFDIEFWPRVDLGAPGLPYPPPTDVGLAISLHALALQSLIENGLPQGFGFAIVAGALGPAVADLTGSVTTALLTAGGAVAAIPIETQQVIQQQSLAALAAAAPYQASDDPTESSPASDAAARIQAIQNLMATAQPPVATVQAVNPNLVVLAAQYYGDSSQWRYLAAANGLTDPQPVGAYNIVVPQPPS